MKSIFSHSLKEEIRHVFAINSDDGNIPDGVEEIVGDNLTGSLRTEWDKLMAEHGWNKMMKAVKGLM